LLLEDSRSLSAPTRACTAKLAAAVLRAITFTWAVSLIASMPMSQVATSPVKEQEPSVLLTESMDSAELPGNVTVRAVPWAPTLPPERTTKGSVKGIPASPDTEVTPGSTVTSANCAAVTQLAAAITGCMVSMLHWENVE
jgi:hypothetical protein